MSPIDLRIKLDDAQDLINNKFGRIYSDDKVKNIIECLISEGLLVRGDTFIQSDQVTFLSLAFERLANHQVAISLVEAEIEGRNDLKDFVEKWIEGEFYYGEGIILALGILLPEGEMGVEIFELLKFDESAELSYHIDHCEDIVYNSFINSMLWRNPSSINIDKFIKYIKSKTNTTEKWATLIDVLCQLATLNDHPLNADMLDHILNWFTRNTLDEFWVKLINRQYSKNIANPYTIQRLILWLDCRELDTEKDENNELLRLSSVIMTWFLSSSNRELRDHVTKLLVKIHCANPNGLVSYVTKFSENVDPYIVERVWGVAYGTVLRMDRSKQIICEVAKLSFQKIYSEQFTVSHALIRNYSLGIIELANFLGFEHQINLEHVRQMKGKGMPSTSLFKKYALDLLHKPREDIKSGERRILSSMVTNWENSMYGDFGRYVFESRLRNWGSIEGMKAYYYALYLIFKEYAFNGSLDDRPSWSSYHGRFYSGLERIGKKYQWVALHEVAAKLTDSKPQISKTYLNHDSTDPKESYPSPFLLHRDIDVSMYIPKYNEDIDLPKFSIPKFDLSWSIEDSKWVKLKHQLPSLSEMIEFEQSGQKWLNLEGMTLWGNTYPGEYENEYGNPSRELWYWIKSFLIKKDDLEGYSYWASDQSFQRDHFPGRSHRLHEFQREYDWVNSPLPRHDDRFKNVLKESAWNKNVYFGSNEDIPIIMTTDECYWEEGYDHSKEGTIGFLRPVPYLFHGMNMRHGKVDGTYYDEAAIDRLIAFDPAILGKAKSNLFIDKKSLLDFLDAEGLTIVWALFGEKQIIGKDWRFIKEQYPGRLCISGFAYYDNGQLQSQIKTEWEEN